jgi:hypothetical protein
MRTALHASLAAEYCSLGRPAPDDLASLGDEFNATASLAKWKNFDTECGWPNRLRRFA